MSDNILKYRVRSNKGYELNETLNAINEDLGILDTGAAAIKYGARGLKAAGKGAILSIPIVDAIAGTMMLVSGLASFKAVADIVVENLNSDENTFSSALAANNNAAWNNILNQVTEMADDERAILEENFEDLLHNIKSFFTTSIQAYDSIIAAPVAAVAGTAAPVVGAVATELGVNWTTAAIGFLADTVPLERFFVDFAGKLAKIAVAVCEWILGKAEEDGKLNNAVTGAGPVFLAIITNPVVSIARLGEFYTAIETGESPVADVVNNTAKTFATKASLETLIDAALANINEAESYGIDEDLEEESEEEVDEHIVGGFSGPMKAPTKKQLAAQDIWEQKKALSVYAEEVRKLQIWKLQTAGRTIIR